MDDQQKPKREFEIIDDPVEKPKRKPRPSYSIPWRWIVPAFMAGAVIAIGVAVLVAVPTDSIVVQVASVQPTATPPSPATTAPGFGGSIEDIAWNGDRMIVARSNPPRLDLYDEMNWIGQIQPFNFNNEGHDKRIVAAFHPTAAFAATINTNYRFDQGDILAHADLTVYDLSDQGGSMRLQTLSHPTADLNNGNPSIPYLDAAAAFSPDGHLLATGAGGAGKGGGRLALWILSDLAGPLTEFYAGANGTIELAFSSDGQYLTSITRADDGDSTIHCVDCGRVTVWNVSNTANVYSVSEHYFSVDAVIHASISDDGRYLAMPEIDDQRRVMGIGMWALPDMHMVGRIPLAAEGSISEIEDLDLSDDGRIVTYVHQQGYGQDADNLLTVTLSAVQWSADDGFSHESLYTGDLDPLYTARYFLHVDTPFIYYVNPLYQYVTRVDLNNGEQVQMMQL